MAVAIAAPSQTAASPPPPKPAVAGNSQQVPSPAQQAPDSSPLLARIPLIDTKLSNGLRVILVPRHDAPVFGISVTYNVGSRDEKPGRTGFAHLFEHMMFQGSKNVGKWEHPIYASLYGGDLNAHTFADYTNYFESFPKNQLDLALFLESDRMQSLAVNQFNLENQRQVVKEELRLKIDNQPYGHSEREISNLAYDNFAYKHDTGGSATDLDAAKLEDVRDFHAFYYAPNNAALVIIGDIEPEETLRKIRKYFGSIPAHPTAPRPELTEPEHSGERRATIEDPMAPLTKLFIAYHIPPGNTPEFYAIAAVDVILGGGRSARFYQRIQERQLVTGIGSYFEEHVGPSLFVIWATPKAGVTIEKVEKAIYQEIALLQKEKVTQQELKKIRRQYLTAVVDEQETDLGLAVEIGADAVLYGDPELINTELSKIIAVTADDIQKAAEKYLIPRERTVIVTLPGKKPETKE